MKIKCKHIETGNLGLITKELKSGKTFPDQWGIIWEQGQKETLCFWHDKSTIKK